MNSLLSLTLATALIAIALTACGKKDDKPAPPPPPPPPPPVTQPLVNPWNPQVPTRPLPPGAQLLNDPFDNGSLAPSPIMGNRIENKELKLMNFDKNTMVPITKIRFPTIYNYLGSNPFVPGAGQAPTATSTPVAQPQTIAPPPDQQINSPGELTYLFMGGDRTRPSQLQQTADVAEMKFLFDSAGMLNFIGNFNGEIFRASRIPYQFDVVKSSLVISDFFAKSQMTSGQLMGQAVLVRGARTAGQGMIEWENRKLGGFYLRLQDFGYNYKASLVVTNGSFRPAPPAVNNPTAGFEIDDRIIIQFLASSQSIGQSGGMDSSLLRPMPFGTRVIGEPANLQPALGATAPQPVQAVPVQAPSAQAPTQPK